MQTKTLLATSGLTLSLALASLTPSWALDVPFVPTPNAMVDRMLEMADVKETDVLLDLGSGDGRIAIAAAKEHGIPAHGVDLDPNRVAEAKANAKEAGVADRATFEEQNLFETDLSKASIITMYLLPKVNLELKPKLLELTPGTRLVSHQFNLGPWTPDQSDEVDGRDVYLWHVPAKVEGTWRVESPEVTFTLDLDQTYQQVEGTAEIEGKSVPIENASLKGDALSFEVEVEPGSPREFVGRVNGTSIEPMATDASGAAMDWRATKS
ncbi:SAM-dependent methyltransferase [Rhodoligotrophos appendicifer]|uniref:SAM-dependent methyltransferase n=1 Tax=Rhodoligotrophos appendicifer TaxID=987056 RepID=UPI0011860813|nr:50S ribosomal protein L11 methyltransferase [Rhodoligotrophos appendicifer]